jgi:hypothetical protein
MSKYHRILGVSPNATKAEIKEAYRDLAKKLHPDRNSASDANDKFAELQEAYDSLMEDKTSHNPSSENTYPSSGTKRESSKDRFQEARDRLKAQKAREDALNEKYFQKLVSGKRGKFVQIGSVICLIISLCYLFEDGLPYHHISDQIENVSNSIGEGRMLPRDQIVYTKGGEEFQMQLIQYGWAVSNPNITLKKTWFFHFCVVLEQERPEFMLQYPLTRKFYEKPFIPFFFFVVPSILLFYKKRTVTFTAIYMYSFYVVIPIAILFLLFNFRWLHVLTLGFL